MAGTRGPMSRSEAEGVSLNSLVISLLSEGFGKESATRRALGAV